MPKTQRMPQDEAPDLPSFPAETAERLLGILGSPPSRETTRIKESSQTSADCAADTKAEYSPAVADAPPLEYGRIWSKCRFFFEPHCTQAPPSRFHTASFTSLGISRACSTSSVCDVCATSGSPGSRRNLKRNTRRISTVSVQLSSSAKVPLYDQMPALIFSYTRIRAAGDSLRTKACATL